MDQWVNGKAARLHECRFHRKMAQYGFQETGNKRGHLSVKRAEALYYLLAVRIGSHFVP